MKAKKSNPGSGPFDKPPWWRENLTFFRDPLLKSLWSGGKLSCSYYEFLGYSGWRFFDMIRKYLNDDRDFIGVDCNLEVIGRMRGLEYKRDLDRYSGPVGKDVLLRHGYQLDGYAWASTLCNDRIPIRPIGIFNFDDTAEMGHHSWISKIDSIVDGVVEPTIKGPLKSCAIILNAYIQKPGLGGDPVGSRARQAELLVKKLKSKGWTGTATNVDDLVARLQSYSCTKVSEMATLRLFFRAGKATAYKARLGQ